MGRRGLWVCGDLEDMKAASGDWSACGRRGPSAGRLTLSLSPLTRITCPITPRVRVRGPFGSARERARSGCMRRRVSHSVGKFAQISVLVDNIGSLAAQRAQRHDLCTPPVLMDAGACMESSSVIRTLSESVLGYDAAVEGCRMAASLCTGAQ